MTAKRNILIALMLLLLVAASACALAACNNTTAEIFGAQIATDDNGDPMYGGGSYVMPDGMAFSAAASTAAETDTSVTLTANYEPAGTSNKQTNWSVSFKNPSSSWANGKTVTDYVTVQSTGTNTAKVTCLDSFGEQIIVKATSAVDPSISATTTVDYEKKLEDVKFTLYKGSSVLESFNWSEYLAGSVSLDYFDLRDSTETHMYLSVYVDMYDGQYSFEIEPTFSVYTIDRAIELCAENRVGTASMYTKLDVPWKHTSDGFYEERYGLSSDSMESACKDIVNLSNKSSDYSMFAMALMIIYGRYFSSDQYLEILQPDESNLKDFALNMCFAQMDEVFAKYNDSFDEAEALVNDIIPIVNQWGNSFKSELGYYCNSNKIEATDIAGIRDYFENHPADDLTFNGITHNYLCFRSEISENEYDYERFIHYNFYLNPDSIV